MKYSTAMSPVPVLPPAGAVLGTTWANTVGTAAAGADRVGWELSEEDIGGFRGGGGGGQTFCRSARNTKIRQSECC